jgi:hypothetical protein
LAVLFYERHFGRRAFLYLIYIKPGTSFEEAGGAGISTRAAFSGSFFKKFLYELFPNP